jgi:glutamyl-tRNA reductase
MIGVVGTSHKYADLATREVIVKMLLSCDERLKQGSIFLLTCNRAEWYFCTPTPSKTHQEMLSFLQQTEGIDITSHLYTFFGLECFRHLGKVVSGLDSVFVGETEIQGQVKAAYETARKTGDLPQELHFLFQRALHTGKVIRGKATIPEYQGLCDQVSDLALSHMSRNRHPSVLLIGVGAVNRQLTKTLCRERAEVTVINRTDEKAHALASEMGCTAMPWEKLSPLWCEFSCVIASTHSQKYLLQPSNSLPPPSSQLLIDLGVPRNIDPTLATPSRKIVNIESFTPSHTIESVLFARSREDYLSLSRRT